MTKAPKKFDDKTDGKDHERGLRKQTFKLPAAKWHELEAHIAGIQEIVKNAESLDPAELSKGLGLPALTYRGCVFAIDPNEVQP